MYRRAGLELLSKFRQIIDDIGNQKHFDGSKGEKLLGRPYHTPEEAVLSAAESLIRFNLIKPKAK